MSTSFTNPTIVADEKIGAQTAQKYFQDTFGDTSFVIINAAPFGLYKCYTIDNPQNEFYFKVEK